MLAEPYGQLVPWVVGPVALGLEVACDLLDPLGLLIRFVADPLVRGDHVVLRVGDEQHRREREGGDQRRYRAGSARSAAGTGQGA
jgi:hypothetical protein